MNKIILLFSILFFCHVGSAAPEFVGRFVVQYEAKKIDHCEYEITYQSMSNDEIDKQCRKIAKGSIYRNAPGDFSCDIYSDPAPRLKNCSKLPFYKRGNWTFLVYYHAPGE